MIEARRYAGWQMFELLAAGTSILPRASAGMSLRLSYRKPTHGKAQQVAQRICESIANDSNGPRLSVSVGVAVYHEMGIRLRSCCAKPIRRFTR